MTFDPRMPCGRCDVGIYSYAAVLTPLAHDLHALRAEDRRPPKCKSMDRACVGACDFIDALAKDPGEWDRIKQEVSE